MSTCIPRTYLSNPFSDLVYLGGVLHVSREEYAKSVEPHNTHFNQHIRGTHASFLFVPPMDQIHQALPRLATSLATPDSHAQAPVLLHGRGVHAEQLRGARHAEPGLFLCGVAYLRLNTAQIDTYGYLVADDIMRVKLLELLNGKYATNPLLVTLPAPTMSRFHADHSDVHTDTSVVPGSRDWRGP